MPNYFCKSCKKNWGPRSGSCPKCFENLVILNPSNSSQQDPIKGTSNRSRRIENDGHLYSANQNNAIVPIVILALVAFILVAGFALISVSQSGFVGEISYEILLPRTTWLTNDDGSSRGSGCLINYDQKLVLTAFHVIKNNNNPLVFFRRYSEGKLETSPKVYTSNTEMLGIPSKVVFTDPEKDIAILKLERVPDFAKEVTLAKNSPAVGSKIFIMGQSGAGKGTLWRMSTGTVRQVYEREIHYKGQLVKALIVETQSSTNRGDSGGPGLNVNGELVAIVTGSPAIDIDIDWNIDITEIKKCISEYLQQNNTK